MTDLRQPIQLDRRIKFVNVVLAVADGDEPLESAAHLLAEIEQRHGLKIVSSEFYTGEKDASGEWCMKTLFPFLTETHFVISGGDLFNSCVFFDPQDYDAHGPEISFTWREWGHWMARWANKFWMPRPEGLGENHQTRRKRNWNYMDFYMRDYLSYQIENYEAWADTVIRVIGKKTEMRL